MFNYTHFLCKYYFAVCGTCICDTQLSALGIIGFRQKVKQPKKCADVKQKYMEHLIRMYTETAFLSDVLVENICRKTVQKHYYLQAHLKNIGFQKRAGRKNDTYKITFL